jgi:3-hydroxyisobutyrate dehydrogenase-like beta-hydroxyacid dehydrogenase
MSRIAIIGAGPVAATLAAGLKSAGHTVVVGVRDVAKASPTWAGMNVDVAEMTDAASGTEIIINATPGEVSVM